MNISCSGISIMSKELSLKHIEIIGGFGGHGELHQLTIKMISEVSQSLCLSTLKISSEYLGQFLRSPRMSENWL